MPGRDRTGPMGDGVLTGRGMGPCAGMRGAMYGYGRGFARGMGAGRLPDKTRRETLQAQRDALQDRLERIDRQLKK